MTNYSSMGCEEQRVRGPFFRWNPYSSAEGRHCVTQQILTHHRPNTPRFTNPTSSIFGLSPTVTSNGDRLPQFIPFLGEASSGTPTTNVVKSSTCSSPLSVCCTANSLLNGLSSVDQSDGGPSRASSFLSTSSLKVAGDRTTPFDAEFAALVAQYRLEADPQIELKISRLPKEQLYLLAGYLERTPTLCLDLCHNERGNILANVLKHVGSAYSAALFNWFVAELDNLLTHQKGSIAFTRLYDACSPAEQCCLNDAVLERFETLAVHPFGNYPVQHVIKLGALNVVHNLADKLTRCIPLVLAACGTKCGSHVIETFVLRCPSPYAEQFVEALFSNELHIQTLGNCLFGNYVLQRCIRRVKGSQPLLFAWAAENIPRITSSSKFALNIRRALGLELRQTPTTSTTEAWVPATARSFTVKESITTPVPLL